MIQHLDEERKRHRVPGKTKLSEEEETALQTGMSEAASLFVNPNAIYTFRLTTYYNLTFDGAGLLYAFFSTDASAFSEHTAYLKYLFQEVRIRRARLTLGARCGTPAADGSVPNFAVSSTQKYVATYPTSAQGILDEADSCMKSSNAFDPSPTSYTRVFPADMLFASVSTPAPEINVGCWGQFQIANFTPGPLTGQALTAMLECWYEYRSRD